MHGEGPGEELTEARAPRRTCRAVLSAAGLGLVLLLGSRGGLRADELSDKGRPIFEQHHQAVVTLDAVASSRIWIPGMRGQTNEARHSISGTVLNGAGLTAVSLSALDPEEALKTMAAARDPRLKVETELKSLEILQADGSRTSAEVVLREPDLDLALVRPTTKPGAAWAAVDLSQPGKAQVLDQVVSLNRLGAAAGLSYSASAERISAIVEQPHHFFIPDANMTTATLGSPAFTLEGKFLGMFLIHRSGNQAQTGTLDPRGETLTGIILPADELLKATQKVASSTSQPAK